MFTKPVLGISRLNSVGRDKNDERLTVLIQARPNSISRSFLLEAGDCDVELGEANDKSWGKFNPMQTRSEFRQLIRLFGVVYDGLKIAGLWHRSVI